MVRSGVLRKGASRQAARDMMFDDSDALLVQPALRSHVVKFYDQDAQLEEAICPYLAGAAGRGDTVVIVATPEHQALFTARLQRSGCDPEGLARKGRLVRLDAAETLAAILGGGDQPDRERFQRVIGNVMEGALSSGSGRVSAFGEMVDLLWRDGRREAALRLERFWGEFLMSYPLTLFCSYRTGLLDAADHAALERICGSHSHALPAEDRPRLDAAVQSAFRDVFGSRAELLHPLIQTSLSTNRTLGSAERTVFWLRRNLPTHLDQVLDRARHHLAGPD